MHTHTHTHTHTGREGGRGGTCGVQLLLEVDLATRVQIPIKLFAFHIVLKPLEKA